MSPSLSAALAKAERPELKDAAVTWSSQRSENGEVIDWATPLRRPKKF
jgi:hypothetical protein